MTAKRNPFQAYDVFIRFGSSAVAKRWNEISVSSSLSPTKATFFDKAGECIARLAYR